MKNHKIFCLFLGFLFFNNRFTVAQTDSIVLKKFTFGVSVGYLQGAYKIKKANWEASGLSDTLSRLSHKSKGSSLALQLNYHINSRVSLRVQPGFLFDESTFTFFKKDGKAKIYSNGSVYLGLPIGFVFTFPKVKVQPSVLLGLRYIKDIQIPPGRRPDARYLSLLPHDLGFEIGGLMRIKRKKFILQPEINGFFSPFNVLKFENLYLPFKAIQSINRNLLEFRVSVLR